LQRAASAFGGNNIIAAFVVATRRVDKIKYQSFDKYSKCYLLAVSRYEFTCGEVDGDGLLFGNGLVRYHSCVWRSRAKAAYTYRLSRLNRELERSAR